MENLSLARLYISEVGLRGDRYPTFPNENLTQIPAAGRKNNQSRVLLAALGKRVCSSDASSSYGYRDLYTECFNKLGRRFKCRFYVKLIFRIRVMKVTKER